MRFDFFNDNREIWMTNFCLYFQLDKEKTRLFFESINPDILTPNILVEKFNLDLKKYDSSNVEIVARHMTTTPISSIKENGLMDLKHMLQGDTLLSSFLNDYGIKVNVDEKLISILDEKYPILTYKEPCAFCYSNRDIEKCDEYSKCDLRKSIEVLALKLYTYGATVEFFIHASLEQMKRYSSIIYCPEILVTLDKIRINARTKELLPANLCSQWRKTHTKCVIVEFPVKLSEMETYAPCDYNSTYYNYEVCFENSGFDYCDYIDRTVPQNFLDNLIFLKWFISIFFYESEEMGSLLPNQGIESNQIRFIDV